MPELYMFIGTTIYAEYMLQRKLLQIFYRERFLFISLAAFESIREMERTLRNY
jgi:hypothetical protein